MCSVCCGVHTPCGCGLCGVHTPQGVCTPHSGVWWRGVWCAVCFLFLFSFLFLFLFRFYFFDSDAVGRHQNGNQPLLAADFWRLCAAAPPCFCAENSLVWQTSEFLGPRIAGRRPGALQPGPQIPVGPQKVVLKMPKYSYIFQKNA